MEIISLCNAEFSENLWRIILETEITTIPFLHPNLFSMLRESNCKSTLNFEQFFIRVQCKFPREWNKILNEYEKCYFGYFENLPCEQEVKYPNEKNN